MEYVISFGTDSKTVASLAAKWSSNFMQTFEESKRKWDKRYQDAFVPNNGHFSGNLPVLETDK